MYLVKLSLERQDHIFLLIFVAFSHLRSILTSGGLLQLLKVLLREQVNAYRAALLGSAVTEAYLLTFDCGAEHLLEN